MNGQAVKSCSIEHTEHMWIPMPDGIRLAARLWRPASACDQPVPALLEYIPYRKHDMVRARDERNHPYFAAHGYACLRVDMRGSGDSDGTMPDMYSDAELSDARDVIDWIAAQPWCNGRVGMFGTSWGGTASLQASQNKPDALKAIIAVCATHDRYEDDIHHKGGCLLTDTFEWGATLPAILASPPSPHAGPDWMERWAERLRALEFPVEHWVREEARGAYWRRGSIKHAPKQLDCPILAIGGWSDRYSNSVMSLVDARPDLAWGIVGPWGHHYPDQGHPGPGIGFQQIALDWWDHWLKHDTPPNWPRLRIWMREFDPPGNVLERRNGRWIESGPARDHAKVYDLHLSDDGLSDILAAGHWIVPIDLRHGETSGDTGYFGRYGGLPLDQNADDQRVLTFETSALEQDLVLYGSAALTVRIQAQGQNNQLIARLVDVAPDGRSNRVALSVLNLALDENLDAPPTPHGPDPRDVTLRFHTKAYRFKKGHRIRLAIASSYWPMIWTPPDNSSLTIHEGRLDLPLFEGALPRLNAVFPEPQDLPVQKTSTVLSAPPLERHFDITSDGWTRSRWHQPETAIHHSEIQTTFAYETSAEHQINPKDPLSCSSYFSHAMRFERPDGTACVSSSLRATATAEEYHLDAELQVTWDGKDFHRDTWHRSIPRRHS